MGQHHPNDTPGTIYVVRDQVSDKIVCETSDFDFAVEFMGLDPDEGRWAWEDSGRVDTEEHYLTIAAQEH